MSIDGDENFPIGDHENSDTEKKENLLTKDTKEELVKVLDDWDTIAGGPVPPLLRAAFGEKIRYVPLSGKENEISIDIDIFKVPEGANLDTPNLRWIVVLDDPQNSDFSNKLLISEIPDGWDVEYQPSKHLAVDKMDVEIALSTEDNAFFEEKYAQGQARMQRMRELDMARVSDKKAKDIIDTLRKAEKREMPK